MSSRKPHDSRSISTELVHDRAHIERLTSDLISAMERLGYSRSAVFAARLALGEAVANAFQHGHAGLDPRTPISVRCELSPACVRLEVADRGPGFDPDSVPDPTLDENLRRPGGRGIMLMRAFMSEVEFTDGGRRVRMCFARSNRGPRLPLLPKPKRRQR